jgi:hypothetical protein
MSIPSCNFEDPRRWFRFTDNRYAGLGNRMAYLPEFGRAECQTESRAVPTAVAQHCLLRTLEKQVTRPLGPFAS